MSLMSNLDLIRRVPLFSMLTNEQAQSIADAVVKRRLRRGASTCRRTPANFAASTSPTAWHWQRAKVNLS